MKTRLSCILLLFLFVIVSGFSQDTRTLPTKVADLLARFPADDQILRDRLAGELLSLGESGIAAVTRQLVPAGTGNDTNVRYAVNCLAAYAGRFGAEPQRALAESSLLQALGAATDTEVKTFLMSQLRLIGRDATVRAAAPLLSDAVLVEPATQLLLSVGGAAAQQAILEALAKSSGPAQITLVKALGEFRVAEANRAILGLVNTANLNLRKVCLAALARMADGASFKILAENAQKAKYQYDAANSVGALLDYARNLGRKGDTATCAKVCRLVMKSCRTDQLLANSSAALAILVEYFGFEALPDLLRAVDSTNKAYRVAALNQAEKVLDVSSIRRWTAKAQQATPELRSEIVAMLGRKGNPLALPFIRASLASPESATSLEAASALARMKKSEALPELLPLLKTKKGEDLKGITEILLWTMDEPHLDPLVGMIEALEAPAKACAIQVIAAKSGKRFVEKIFSFTSDANPEVKSAAIAAMKRLAGPANIPALLRLLDSAGDPGAIKDLQAALVYASGQIEPANLRAKPLLEALGSSPRREQLLEILPQVGGSDALRSVVQAFDQPDTRQKDIAFRALVQWKDPEAAQKLYQICAQGEAKYKGEAFTGFLRQVSSSSLPAEQKLLQLRKILVLASDGNARRSVIRALERVKTFSSFMVLSRFIDDPELGNEAAWAAMRVALPSSGSKDGLIGTQVRQALEKVLQVLSGPESEYSKEDIRSYLASMPATEGFLSLFNGRDLTGWKGLVENPVARAKMGAEELVSRQREADRRMLDNWSVRDGMIVFNGKGQNLCTVKDYADFEMLVDWRITPGGDSGIYLRGTPQVQIWDTARTDAGAQVGSGGLYNNQKNPSKPMVVADNPVGEWNHLRILMIGEKVTVHLNGRKVVDQVPLENYWDRTQPIFPTGALELQAHGTDLAFRDIFVREVSDKESNLSEAEGAEGFVSLFNGRNLDGWVGNKVEYSADSGVLRIKPQAKSYGNLYTAGEYGDFVFRFEFQLTPGANNGIGIRAPLEGDAAYAGMEIQVLDDTAPVYANLQPYQYHGSVYGVIPARRGFLKPIGEWNQEEILVKGSHVRVTLNGTIIVDGDLLEAGKEGTLDKKQHPGLLRTSGHIGFLGHGSVLQFRNIRVKELSSQK
jgi:HEAT repeat protein